jgi:hypothetical protein
MTFERGMMLWEISPEQMNKSSSQVLLFWEKDLGWSFDLDF